MNYGINKECDNDPVSRLFDHFINAGTFRTILSTFQQLCDAVGLKSVDHRNFYRKIRSRITCWKAQSLWAKLDKRAAHKEYRKGEACADTRVMISFHLYLSEGTPKMNHVGRQYLFSSPVL